MKKYAYLLFLALLIALLSSCTGNLSEKKKENEKISSFKDEVFDLSPDIRAVEGTVDPSWIVIYVYTDYLEIDEDDLKETVVKIAIEHDLADTDDYKVEIRDIDEAVQRYDDV